MRFSEYFVVVVVVFRSAFLNGLFMAGLVMMAAADEKLGSRFLKLPAGRQDRLTWVSRSNQLVFMPTTVTALVGLQGHS